MADGATPGGATAGRATPDGAAILSVLFARDRAGLTSALPTSDAGWDALAARVRDLRAEGLLHAAIRRGSAASEVPEALRDRWRRAHAATTAQNLQLIDEAERALGALAAAGVVAAPMKGIALFREGVVKDLGTRPTTDIDLATRRADRPTTLRVLHDLGFRPSEREVSFKHLTPMRRGDVAIEVHEIAYWSGSDRRLFGAEHLTTPDRVLRLARLWALQVHHLVLGSPPEEGLLVRSLADVAGFLDLAREERGLAVAARGALEQAGLQGEGAALEVILARMGLGELGGSGGSGPADPRVDERLVRSLLTPLEPDFPTDPRQIALAHLLATARRQPVEILARTAAVLLFPPGEVLAEGLGVEVGSPRWWLARVRRPVELGVRVLRTLPGVLRGWAGSSPGGGGNRG